MQRYWCFLGAIALTSGCSDKMEGPGGGGSAEISASACSDATDNDRDGLTDCADPACTVHAWCAGGVDSGPLPGFDGGPRVDAGPRPDTGPIIGCAEPIDVAFVLDVSTSMSDDIAAIRRGLRSIWDAASALTPTVRFGMVVFVDDALAVNDCAGFETVEAMEAEFDRWVAFCSGNRSPVSSTTNTDCAENSLDALYLAATRCSWREGATHILIHVTDDTFVERPATLSGSPFGGGGVMVQHTYSEVVSALTAQMIRVGAFASPSPGEWCGAGSSPNAGAGFHEPWMSQPSLVTATGGMVWNIRDVRAGTLDMATAINEFTEAEHCAPF